MFKATHGPAVATVAWLVAVLGAVAILVSPITPAVLLVELMGVVTCLVASGVLAAVYFRR
jgi:hypothetical protein